MAVAVSDDTEGATVPSSMAVAQAATLEAADVLAGLGTGARGLPADEATRPLRVVGPNAVHSYRARVWPVLRGQLRSPTPDIAGLTERGSRQERGCPAPEHAIAGRVRE